VRTAARCESEPDRILPDPARSLSDVNAFLVLFTDGVTEAEAADGTMCGTSSQA
jgi:hypothetical protein